MANEEIKFIKLRTKNASMMEMYGDKLTWSEWARRMRTNGLHTEIQHTDRYGGVSQSCTMSDGCNGHRFKFNAYKHAYRWSTIYIAVTAAQEARLFAKGCEMAGLFNDKALVKPRIITAREFEGLCFTGNLKPKEIFYGPNHILYDKGAAFFSFISKRNIWKPSKTNMICNRAVAVVLLEVWPDLLDTPKKKLNAARLTPEQLHYLVEHFFEKKT